MWGFIGSPPSQDSEELHIYTHRAFDISYNGTRRMFSSFFIFPAGSLSRPRTKYSLSNNNNNNNNKKLTLFP